MRRFIASFAGMGARAKGWRRIAKAPDGQQ
jgi:hypothetical protein